MSLEYSHTLVLRDISTGTVETRISKVWNQEAKTKQEQSKTEHKNRRNGIVGKEPLEV